MSATMPSDEWSALFPRFERAYAAWGPVRLAEEVGTDRWTVYAWGKRLHTPSRLAQAALRAAIGRYERAEARDAATRVGSATARPQRP